MGNDWWLVTTEIRLVTTVNPLAAGILWLPWFLSQQTTRLWPKKNTWWLSGWDLWLSAYMLLLHAEGFYELWLLTIDYPCLPVATYRRTHNDWQFLPMQGWDLLLFWFPASMNCALTLLQHMPKMGNLQPPLITQWQWLFGHSHIELTSAKGQSNKNWLEWWRKLMSFTCYKGSIWVQ